MNHPKPTIEDLVVRWQENCRRGVRLSVEELCQEAPDLVGPVTERLGALTDPVDSPTKVVNKRRSSTAVVRELPPGPEVTPTTLGGYRIERLLGQGGMGAVYLAHDDRLGRAVALKTMRPEVAARPGAVARFQREARSAARVEHDNVIPIWQVGEDGGIPFIAMPLLVGESLAERLAWEPISPVEVILKVGREVADGLHAAHEKGLIHRDIKPGNLWLEGDLTSSDPAVRFRRCKVLDFGLARHADDVHLTGSGVTLGTPAYVSVEQARGLPVDHRTDLFSLGVVLYRMATGELPFHGPSAMAVLSALAIEVPPPPLAKNPAIPPALSALIMKLLAKNPADRPSSALEVAAALRDLDFNAPPSTSGVENHFVTTVALPTLGELRPPQRRWSRWWAVVVLVFVAALLVWVLVQG